MTLEASKRAVYLHQVDGQAVGLDPAQAVLPGTFLQGPVLFLLPQVLKSGQAQHALDLVREQLRVGVTEDRLHPPQLQAVVALPPPPGRWA